MDLKASVGLVGGISYLFAEPGYQFFSLFPVFQLN